MPENPGPVEVAGVALAHWLQDPARTLSAMFFVPGVDVFEQYSDWATRHGAALFSQRVLLTALARKIPGVVSEVRGGGKRVYLVPQVWPVPEDGCPVAADGFPPPVEDLPWNQYLLSGTSLRDEDQVREAVAWSVANGGRRPPQLGWPWWRIPLSGETVPPREEWK